ncbi:MAG: ISAs1 family transposase, partial [Microscillaceae bacterium]|nr:ISAs1 family transposase [Microscillaceae bacterium]
MEKTLLNYLSLVPDFRKENKNFRHNLLDILFLSVCATFSGAEDFEEIALFGQDKLEFLQTFLPFSNGAPSHDTLRQVFMYLDHEAFGAQFMAWIQACLSEVGLSGKQICIDGKTLRGSKKGIHLVSAVVSELGLSLGQVKTDAKSNEITAIPTLLDLLDLQGCIVSIDAMGTQRSIADKILEKGGDYFLALKGNQGDLFAQVQDQFARMEAREVYQFSDWA